MYAPIVNYIFILLFFIFFLFIFNYFFPSPFPMPTATGRTWTPTVIMEPTSAVLPVRGYHDECTHRGTFCTRSSRPVQ